MKDPRAQKRIQKEDHNEQLVQQILRRGRLRLVLIAFVIVAGQTGVAFLMTINLLKDTRNIIIIESQAIRLNRI